jgi:4-hydroxythreonine-4-phosphate dehydrogenase
MKLPPIIAITIGDPNGIGAEIILKALSKKAIHEICRPIIIGPIEILRKLLDPLSLNLKLEEVNSARISSSENTIPVLSSGFAKGFNWEPGEETISAGAVAGKALEAAADLAITKQVEAVVTAPISKKVFYLAGYHYPGQTEFFAAKTQTDEVVMVLLSENFRVGLVTTHCPLSEVSALLSGEAILRKIQIFSRDLQKRFGIARPRIAVAALNPHAGEDGLFGSEEKEIILPAVSSARALGLDVSGPFPADTLFVRIKQQNFDGYLAMYHDQGLIPLKMQSFGRAVNYTAGLPIIRTSPDHGTAFDIAGKGVADSGSMEEAIKLAVYLAGCSQAS